LRESDIDNYIKYINMKKIFTVALTAILCAAFASTIFAAPAGYTLFGNASITSPGRNSPTGAKLTSEGTTYSGIDFAVTPGLTFADYEKLSFDYKFTAGSCGGGTPRFQIQVVSPDQSTSGTIWVYLGDYPNYTNCQENVWLNSGDLLETGKYVETSDVVGHYELLPYSAAQSTFGSWEITGIQLVVDGGWKFEGGQNVLTDNVMINTTTFTFESANSCKNGGFLNFTSAPGPFSNQGQCVSYFAKGGQ
jgi:hypothetical protein